MQLAQSETASGLQHFLKVPPQWLSTGPSAHGVAAGAPAGATAGEAATAAPAAAASTGSSAAAVDGGPLSKNEMACLFMVGGGEGEEMPGWKWVAVNGLRGAMKRGAVSDKRGRRGEEGRRYEWEGSGG